MDALLQVTKHTDGGPWVSHNYPCPVIDTDPAVWDMNASVFRPSWAAQREGWHLVQATGWKLWLLRQLFGVDKP
jgi:hypothetical protein